MTVCVRDKYGEAEKERERESMREKNEGLTDCFWKEWK